VADKDNLQSSIQKERFFIMAIAWKVATDGCKVQVNIPTCGRQRCSGSSTSHAEEFNFGIKKCKVL
jgi:uncharacterized protein (UPF0179 family)